MPALSRSKRYRERAGDLREMAAHASNEKAKAEFLKLAEQYDQLAADVEKLKDTL